METRQDLENQCFDEVRFTNAQSGWPGILLSAKSATHIYHSSGKQWKRREKWGQK
jgi:hypothetical protein